MLLMVRWVRRMQTPILLLLALCATLSWAFAPLLRQRQHALSSFRQRSSTLLAASSSTVVVVSPPGGVGEVTAVKAAEMGSTVRWLIVSSATSSSSQKPQQQQLVLSQEALDRIALAGGQLDFAGSDTAMLLGQQQSSGGADPKTTLSALANWCGSADAMVCTYDGIEAAAAMAKRSMPDSQDPTAEWRDAIKVAAREASKGVTGLKIVVAPVTEQASSDQERESGPGLVGNLVSGLLGGNKVPVPETLMDAVSVGAQDALFVLRHGQLFGVPESSPDFSALVGGPRKVPELCEEYVMRAVRVDPMISGAGNVMASAATRTSRHSLGDIAARLCLEQIAVQPEMDVAISSQRGLDPPSLETWTKEFERIESMQAAPDGTHRLFTTEFSNVPDVERLADWLATKWAPAVLRTYDIAAIRVGARPVYAVRAGPGRVEVIWQQLVNFDTATVGKMIIQVSDRGLVASRGPGNANQGFGSVSPTPLSGEDVMARRLVEAASQAIEKGLAGKPMPTISVAPEPVVVSMMASAPSSPPAPVAAAESSSTTASSSQESGPRQSGAKRSPERTRGTRRTADESPSVPSADE